MNTNEVSLVFNRQKQILLHHKKENTESMVLKKINKNNQTTYQKIYKTVLEVMKYNKTE